jgi:hypothetical protein
MGRALALLLSQNAKRWQIASGGPRQPTLTREVGCPDNCWRKAAWPGGSTNLRRVITGLSSHRADHAPRWLDSCTTVQEDHIQCKKLATCGTAGGGDDAREGCPSISPKSRSDGGRRCADGSCIWLRASPQSVSGFSLCNACRAACNRGGVGEPFRRGGLLLAAWGWSIDSRVDVPFAVEARGAGAARAGLPWTLERVWKNA